MVPFKNILVAYQSENRDRGAIRFAIDLARASGGQVTILEVVRLSPYGLEEGEAVLENFQGIVSRTAEDHLKELAGELGGHDLPVFTRVIYGRPAVELIRQVLSNDHDLVVKTAGGRGGVADRLLGSIDMRLLRACPCPVMIMKDGRGKPFRRILAAVDPVSVDERDLNLNGEILRVAAFLAEFGHAEIHVLHAWSAWGESLLRSRIRSEELATYVKSMRNQAARALAETLSSWRSVVPGRNRHLLKGDPEKAIPLFISKGQIDLLVMGTVAREGFSGFLVGNTAEMILGRIACSVLALKPRGFVSPIKIKGSD